MFLNALRRSKTPVAIFLTKGVRLQGAVSAFDSFALELRRGAAGQLLYKHAIATIVPSHALDGFDVPAGIAAMESSDSLQDQFLGRARAERTPMSLYLVNGVMLEGLVVAFDQYCVLLERSGVPQLIYKHAISTLQQAAAQPEPRAAARSEEASA